MMTASIAHSHRVCCLAFQDLITTIKNPARSFEEQASPAAAGNEFDRYKVWAGNVGAGHSGRNYRISLDYRLRDASFYKDRVS